MVYDITPEEVEQLADRVKSCRSTSIDLHIARDYNVLYLCRMLLKHFDHTYSLSIDLNTNVVVIDHEDNCPVHVNLIRDTGSDIKL